MGPDGMGPDSGRSVYRAPEDLIGLVQPAAPDAPAPPPPAVADADRGEPAILSWAGSPWEMTGLAFINFLLSIVTLGIYSFWGKTEVRKRLWSSVRLQGEPFAYAGTGGELFKGFLFAFAVFFVPIFALSLAVVFIAGPDSPLNDLMGVVVYVIIFLFMGIAIYRARRYRLRRTLWRGIRGGMSGSPKSFAWLWIWTSMLLGMTMGWFAPQRAIELQKRLNNETTFGSESLKFEGSSGPLYPPFAVLWCGVLFLYIAVIVGVLATIGFGNLGRLETFRPSNLQIGTMVAVVLSAIVVVSILSSWYQARKLMLFAQYTTFDKAGFKLALSGWGLIGLFLTNILITIVSLSILSPVVQARTLKYFVDRMSMHGTIDFARITQTAQQAGAAGEGLAQAFDVDAF